MRRCSVRSSTAYLVRCVRDSDRFCLSSTLKNWSSWSKAVDCRRTSMLIWWRSSLWLVFACCSRCAFSEDFRLCRWHCELDEVEHADVELKAIWCATDRRQPQLPTLRYADRCIPITPARSIRDRSIYIDADLSVRAHVKRTVSRCFAALCQLRQIRRAEPTATNMLIVALIHSRLYYGNAVLVGIPAYTWYSDCDRCSMRRHDSSIICDHTTTSLRRWRHCTCPRTRTVQNRGADVQSASWQRAAMSKTSYLPRPFIPPLVVFPKALFPALYSSSWTPPPSQHSDLSPFPWPSPLRRWHSSSSLSTHALNFHSSISHL